MAVSLSQTKAKILTITEANSFKQNLLLLNESITYKVVTIVNQIANLPFRNLVLNYLLFTASHPYHPQPANIPTSAYCRLSLYLYL